MNETPMNETPLNGSPDPDAPAPENDLVTLDIVYERAFLGPSFSVSEPPRVVYSLVALTRIEQVRLACDLETAQKSVLSLMEAVTGSFGHRAPIFVDTSQGLRPKKEKSRIIRPGGR